MAVAPVPVATPGPGARREAGALQAPWAAVPPGLQGILAWGSGVLQDTQRAQYPSNEGIYIYIYVDIDIDVIRDHKIRAVLRRAA